MPSMITIDKPNLLIVEGKEDELFFEGLVKSMELQDIQILPIGGKEKLPKNLKALKSSPGFSKVISLCVVRDADQNPEDAFRSVCKALRISGLPAPKKPFEIISNNSSLNKLRVGIMILPNANSPGKLEDLCLKSVEQERAIPCVERYFKCLEENGVLRAQDLSKAKVQVYLASKPKTLRLGEAAKAGYWPLNDDAFLHLKKFLKSMFQKV